MPEYKRMKVRIEAEVEVSGSGSIGEAVDAPERVMRDAFKAAYGKKILGVQNEDSFRIGAYRVKSVEVTND